MIVGLGHIEYIDESGKMIIYRCIMYVYRYTVRSEFIEFNEITR